MARIGSLVTTMEEEDSIAPVVNERQSAGFCFGGFSLWTRDGYHEAREDLIKLSDAVLNARVLLEKRNDES